MPTLFLITPYPEDTAPSQRFRFEQYIPALKHAGFTIERSVFWDDKVWPVLYKPGQITAKLCGLLRGLWRRTTDIWRASKADYIFIHREFSPVGYPWPVWVMRYIFNKKIIFDFDDAIWIPNTSDSNKWTRHFRSYAFTSHLIRWSYKASCGNAYLQNYAAQFTDKAQYIPTTIDTAGLHNKTRPVPTSKFVIGWTGTHSTTSYLTPLLPVIEKINAQHPLELHIVSDVHPDWDYPFIKFIKWNKETEIDDLCKFSIGLMPLTADSWSEGKCGFKALQYMALGIPALVSPIGVNTHIVTHQHDGFICPELTDWDQYIRHCITHPEVIESMKETTRQTVINRYSVQAITPSFLALFD